MELGIWAGDPSGLEVCWVSHALRGPTAGPNWPRLTCPALVKRQAGRGRGKMSATSRAGRDTRTALLRRRGALVWFVCPLALTQLVEGALDGGDPACGHASVASGRGSPVR